MGNHLLFEIAEHVAIITMNRPLVLNALSNDTLAEFNNILTDVEKDAAIKGVILTGTGKAFVAGADVHEMVGYNPEQCREYIGMGQRIISRMELIQKPFLAAVNGYALGGGCELCMACDFRYAGEKAVFALPELGLGIIPGFGGSQRLPRLVGLGLAKEIMYTGRSITAQEALRIGLVNRVCAPENLMVEAMETMKLIVSKPAHALRYAKTAVNSGMDTDLRNALQLELELISLCFAEDDQKEGMRAFLEKRSPKFSS